MSPLSKNGKRISRTKTSAEKHHINFPNKKFHRISFTVICIFQSQDQNTFYNNELLKWPNIGPNMTLVPKSRIGLYKAIFAFYSRILETSNHLPFS